jgi:hypothetical protein
MSNEYIEYNIKNTPAPEEVNQLQKDEYTRFNENLNKEELKETFSYADLSWGKTIEQSISNLPGDLIPFYKDYATGIYQTIRHPVITSKSIGKLGVGILAEEVIRNPKIMRYLPPEQAKGLYYFGSGKSKAYETTKDDEMTKMWMAVEDELVANFGTEANFKKYIAENPTAALMTLAEILIPVAKLGKVSSLTKLSKASAKTERIAGLIDPLTLTGEVIGVAKSKFLSKDIPETLHKKSLQLMRKDFGEKKIQGMIDASIALKLSPTNKKMTRLQDSIDLIGDMKQKARDSVGSNLRIPVEEIFKGLDDFQENMLSVSSEGIKVKHIVNDIKKSIRQANREISRKNLTINELNDYKVQFNKELDKFYKQAAATSEALPLRKEIKSVINRTMREYLEIIVPETKITGLFFRKEAITKRYLKKKYGVDVNVKQLDEIQGNLLELRKVMTDISDKLEVGPIMDFMVGQKASTGGRFGAIAGTAITGEISAGTAVGYGIGHVAGFSIGLLDSSPKLKMQLGNFLSSLRAAGIPIRPSATLTRMGLYEAGNFAATH